MEDLLKLLDKLLPLVGVIAGIFLNEWFHNKRDRDYFFAKEVAIRKLEAYEAFDKKVHYIGLKAKELFGTLEAVKSEKIKTGKFDAFSAEVLDFFRYLDENELYLDREIIDHFALTFITPAELKDLKISEKDYKYKVTKLSEKFNRDLLNGQSIIKELSGISKVNKSLKNINKPVIDSDYIRLFQEARKKYKKAE